MLLFSSLLVFWWFEGLVVFFVGWLVIWFGVFFLFV